MRTYPKDASDRKDLKRLNADPWMVDVLKVNPSYVFWGPHEDYMWKKGEGWDTPIIKNTWKEFGPWDLDELNEVVHFYFEILRESVECPLCGGSGYHPDAQWVEKSWYRHNSPFTMPTEQERLIQVGMHERFGSPLPIEIHGRGSFPSEEILNKYKPEFRAFCEAMRDGDGFWSNKITQEEVDTLVKGDRLVDYTHNWTQEDGWKPKPGGVEAHIPSAAQVNAAQNKPGLGGHDGINQAVCVRARCERYGIPVTCPDCEGHGYVFTAPKATLGLVLWVIHPRKGCSRGVEIKSIEQSELKEVSKYLKCAAARNAERFSKIKDII